MKKTFLLKALSSLVMFLGFGASEAMAEGAAADRDCARYSAEEAVNAASDPTDNRFSATFSAMAQRRGNTNSDCSGAAGSGSSSGEYDGHSGGSAQ